MSTAHRGWIAGLALLWLVAAAPPPAARGAVTTREVAAAVERCGLQGHAVERTGRRRFSVWLVDPVTTVTTEEGPISPERQREMQAADEAAMRPWNCLQLWARHRRVTVEWPPHEVIIFD